MRNVAIKAVFWIWMSVLTWLSVRDTQPSTSWLKDLFSHPDKIMHFGAYALTTLLGLIAFSRGMHNRKRELIIVFGCWAWSVFMELMQLTISNGRHFEVLDIIANIIGCFAGVAAFRFIFKARHYGSK